jgi:hypothetical protein
MHRNLSAITLCAAVAGGCSPGQAPPQDPPPKPAAPQDPPPGPAPAVPKVWQLRLMTQFLGTVPGPLQVVFVDSGGPVKVEVDGKVVGEATLAATELEPLARLLAAPALAAARSISEQPGPQVSLAVTGDVRLDLQGPLAELNPVVAEVDRLRDLVGPPEDFKITVVDGDAEILVSSNGYVEVKRGGSRVATHNLPVDALGKVRSILGMTAMRSASAWAAPDGGPELRIEGDLNVRGKVDTLIKSAGSAMLAEVKRLGDAVAAKTTRPALFEAVFTRQLLGAGPGPLRKITVTAKDRRLVLADAAPGVQPSDRPLKDEEWTALLDMLVDPGFRLLQDRPPSGEGTVYRVKITGDRPMELAIHGEPPPQLVALLNHLEYLARHY